MTTHPIITINHEAKVNKWPYPRTFNALKEAGVTSYIVTFSPFTRTYYGNFGMLEEPSITELESLNINPVFDSAKFEAGLKEHITKKTSYIDFVVNAVKAGVAGYRVDMANRTVTYHGIDPHQTHIELVPNI